METKEKPKERVFYSSAANLALGNPPSKYRHRWRRLARARWRAAVLTCGDYDTLQVFKFNHITSVYDWY